MNVVNFAVVHKMIKHERTGTEDASPNVGPSVPGYLPGTDLAQPNSFTSIQPHTAVQRELFNKIHLFIIYFFKTFFVLFFIFFFVPQKNNRIPG